MRKLKISVVLFVLFCATAIPAMADSVTFSLINPDLTGTPGQTLTWQYFVTNNSGLDIFGLSVNSDLWQNGTPDASVFDGFGAGIADGATMVGSLFSFTGDPNVLNSFNSGTFDLQILLSDGSIVDLLQNYSATIAPGGTVSVPEPGSSSFILVTIIMLGAVVMWKRRHTSISQEVAA